MPRCIALFVVSAALAVVGLPVHAANWPQWRGPQGNGVSREIDLPIAWSEARGVRWKCPLPQWGNSTPIVWDDAVFVTTHENNERLLLLRIEKQSGRVVWTRQVGTAWTPSATSLAKHGQQRRHQLFHNTHNLATPSPITDGEVVIVHFGNGVLAAYDFDGRRLWGRNLQQDHGEYTIWWGHANSPVLNGDLVISVCMQDSCHDLPGAPSESYVLAHDKRTGREAWKTRRMTAATHESCDAYTTPILRDHDGRRELVVMGGQMLDAYEPSSGRRLWYLPELVGNRLIPSPVAAHGMIYATQGMRRPLLAVRPGGDGRRTRRDVAWEWTQGTPDSPTPVVWGEHLYMVDNGGVARCLNAHTGRLMWKERVRGEYRASPLAAEGRIYLLNTEGLTTVVSASARFSRLTENQLDDGPTYASLAVSDAKIFLRGRKWLYSIGR